MRICTKCIQPDTRPGVFFNEESVCGACLWEDEKKKIDWAERKKELEIVVNDAKKSNAVYIGDMFVDYKAAKNAGIHFIYAAYGYGSKKKIYKYSIRKIEDIIKKVSL